MEDNEDGSVGMRFVSKRYWPATIKLLEEHKLWLSKNRPELLHEFIKYINYD